MATRKIKDAKDLSTNELIYFKGHAKATYMSDGRNVEEAIHQIGTGGGGGGITVETDPVFSASPAASITEEKKAEWDSKMDKVTLAAVATSGSYNDLSNKPTIPSAVTESTVSGWGFTKNTGTYSKPSGGIPKTDLASAVQTSLGKADTALQSYTEQYKGTVTGVKINGTTKNPSSGVVDLGTVITAHQTLKTINGESIVGSGNITIQGGGVSSYTTNFTYRELYEVAFSEGKSIECNVQLIEDALRNNIPVFVPIDTTDPSYYGYAVLEGYAEDFLYFSVKTANEIIGVEISRTASEIRSEDINKKGVIAIEEESVSKEIVGDLEVANVKGLYSGGSVYALPDQANGDEDDVLLSRGTVKTINGQTIMRDGDNDDIITVYKRVTTNLSSVELLPNTIIEWDQPILQDLVLTFGEQPSQDYAYAIEYIARFTVGSDGVQLIVPNNVVWADGVLPAMTNGKTYEISFVDNLATFLEF